MEKQRQIKILSIIALVLAIAGMSLGFAAFSATLNISSSASVSPNSDDFKVRFVGINGDDKAIVSAYSTSEKPDSGFISADGLSISGINVSMQKFGDGAQYSVYIENQGQYDAIITKKGMNYIEGTEVKRRCTGDDVSPALLDGFCQSISFSFTLYSLDNEILNSGSLVLKKGEKIKLVFSIIYPESSWYVDGPVSVEFGDVYFDFGVYAE